VEENFMIKIEAIVREEKLEDIKEALTKIEVNGVTVSQVMGCGKQKGYQELVRGMEVSITMLPKIKFEIIVSSEEWEQKTIKAIQEAAFTGNPGDGKIFSYDLRSVMRVRTKETGMAAIN
jgi:nitrogen regulatory protein P-II 1